MDEKLDFLDLPNEVLFNIFLYIPDIDNYKYKFNNKNLTVIIEAMINLYIRKFSSIDQQWQNDIQNFTRKLFLLKGSNDLIIFLYNNIESSKQYVQYYVGYYGNDYLLNLINFKNYNLIASVAAENGYISTVMIAVAKGANNYNRIAFIAASNGYLDIVKYVIDKGANNYNKIAEIAAKNGYLAIVKYAFKKGADNYNAVNLTAAKNGYLRIVKYVIKNGANNYAQVALIAIRNNYIKIVKYVARKSGEDYERIKKLLLLHGYENIVNAL